MRVLISGYYGFGNLGDEALLDVIVAQIRRRFPGVDIEVLSAAPTVTAAALHVIATPRWPWRSVREAVARADVVVSGGGGLLQNATSTRSLLYYAGVLREAASAKRAAMVFAQSVGPLDRWGRLIVRRFCSGVRRATVRDERSRELLRALVPGVPIDRTADPVFLYDLDERADLAAEGLGPESGPYAVVSVRKIPGIDRGIATIARTVDRLAREHGIRSAFLPLGGAGDAEVSTAVIRACSSPAVLLPHGTLPNAAAILRGARVVVGMRLHALILAARFGVPFLAIPYDPKVSALCEELEYPLEPLWTPPGAVPAAADADVLIDRLVAQRDALSAHLAGRVAVARDAAAQNFDALGELLRDEGASRGESGALP